ncbi:MAG: hypothetical protein U5K54_01340 [Cytophagales bacterium]|nr:hypothetical protein [Cytophagales bacterium]
MIISILKKGRILLGLAFILSGSGAFAQETFPSNDVKDSRAGLFAFTNATLVVDPQTTIQNATLLIKGNRVEQVGSNLAVPKGYVTIDLKGKYIYPSLIDMFTSYGLPDMERTRGGGFGGTEQMESKPKVLTMLIRRFARNTMPQTNSPLTQKLPKNCVSRVLVPCLPQNRMVLHEELLQHL